MIDYGQKGTVAATQRGAWSDVKYIPSSSGYRYPAIAYYDGSASAGSMSIKFAYWNGSQYVVENVAGDTLVAAGSATWVRLVFLSTGVPMIFWTTGATTVKAAMRSAATTTANATWTATVIDTVAGAANRALEVAVSPLDQIAGVYLTNTTTAGRPRFFYCDSNCSSPLSIASMTLAADTIENSAIVAAQMSTGVAWCKNSSTSYYPAVVFGGNTSSVRYGVCQGSLSSCATAAGWTKLDVVANANIGSKLYIDPTLTGDTPKILTKNAANLQAFQIAQNCNATPTSVTTNANTFGTGANSGSAWMNLLKDSNGTFHVVANESTTSVRYHNSTTTTFATTNWNTAGVIDTLTLPAAGSGGGGADLSNTLGTLLTSFGGGAAPFGLEVGEVNDITVASSSASAIFSNINPDQTGMMQLSSSQVRNISVSATSGGTPAVAYIDFSSGANAGAKLKYALRNGTSATSSWIPYIIPGTGTPQYPSLAFDANNKPWISYYDGATFRFYLATNSSTDGSGTWSQFLFPLTSMTANPTLPATNDTALAMQYISATSYYPVMFIMNSSAGGSNGVKVSRYNPNTGIWSTVQTVDSLGASFGSNLSVDYQTSTSSIAVGYLDITNARVKYNYATDPTAAFGTSQSVSAASQGQGLTVKINPSTSKPAMAYYDHPNGKVYYASCSGTLATCQSSGGWTPQVIEADAGVAGMATGAAGVIQVLQASLTFNSSGVASVLYPTGITSTGDLALNTNSSGSFVKSTFSSATNAILSGASTVNFGISGMNVSSVQTSLGNHTAVYIGPGNWLYSTSCGD